MEDQIPIRPDRSLLLGRQTSKWSLWDVVFHENNQGSGFQEKMIYLSLRPSTVLWNLQ